MTFYLWRFLYVNVFSLQLNNRFKLKFGIYIHMFFAQFFLILKYEMLKIISLKFPLKSHVIFMRISLFFILINTFLIQLHDHIKKKMSYYSNRILALHNFCFQFIKFCLRSCYSLALNVISEIYSDV